MKNILKRTLLVWALLIVSLNAGIYDTTYSLSQDSKQSAINPTDIYMTDDFIEIIRFDRIEFAVGMDNKLIQSIINQIKSYNKKDKKIHIRILGHTQEVNDNANENTINSKTYVSRMQNFFRSSYDTNQSNQDSRKFALQVKEKMLDNNISKDIITVEYRGAKDLVFSDATDAEIDLSNRVMVTMYVSADADNIDMDADGIVNYKDDCLNTPKGIKVDKRGCALDSDRDGIADYKDSCADTPIAAQVDENGCPFDDDKDGIFDYADVCPNTSLGVTVDMRGCPLKSTLN